MRQVKGRLFPYWKQPAGASVEQSPQQQNFAIDCLLPAGYTREGMNFELNGHSTSEREEQGHVVPMASTQRPGAARRRAMAVLRRLCLCGIVAIVALPSGLMTPEPVQAQSLSDPAEVQESRDRVLGSGGYQTERPEPPEVEKRGEPLRLPPWLVEAFLWTIAAILLVMVAVFLFNALQNRTGFKLKRNAKAPPSATLVETPLLNLEKAVVDRSLEEADALAAQGRFAEAIHLLLLVAMDRLRRELGARIAPALTGREVLQRVPVPPAVIEPLTRMVSLSELKHFGGRDAAVADYDRCRQDFLHFSGQGEPVR